MSKIDPNSIAEVAKNGFMWFCILVPLTVFFGPKILIGMLHALIWLGGAMQSITGG